MSWADWACLGILIFGIALFLYGANYYEDFVGWIGVFLIFGGIIAFLFLYIYGELTKKDTV